MFVWLWNLLSPSFAQSNFATNTHSSEASLSTAMHTTTAANFSSSHFGSSARHVQVDTGEKEGLRTIAGASNIHAMHSGQVVHPVERGAGLIIPPGYQQIDVVWSLQEKQQRKLDEGLETRKVTTPCLVITVEKLNQQKLVEVSTNSKCMPYCNIA